MTKKSLYYNIGFLCGKLSYFLCNIFTCYFCFCKIGVKCCSGCFDGIITEEVVNLSKE